MAIILNGTSGIITPGITNTGPFIFEGPVTVPAGTASSPSVSFTGSTNTGLYLSATGAVSISTAGTQRVVVSASGDVGIGTGSPQNDSGYGGLTVNGSSGSIITLRAGGSNSGRIYTTGTDNINIDANGTASTNILFRTGTSSTERARIDAAGNFGLGVTPSSWSTGGNLQLNNFGSKVDGISFANNAYFDSGWKYASNGFAGLYSQVVGQHVWYRAVSGTTGNSVSFTAGMVLNDSGKLLLNTTSVLSEQMRIKGSNTTGSDAYAYLNLTNEIDSDCYFYITGTASTDKRVVIGPTTNTTIAFQTASTERARLSAAGNFGLGTTSPRAKMDVNGAYMTAYTGSNLSNKQSGFICQSGTNLSSAFGIVIQSGMYYQGDTDASNSNFGVRLTTADGSMGAVTFNVNSANGRMTNPYQPGFLVTRPNGSSDQSLSSDTTVLEFNNAIYNIGSHYNTSTYRFTAPVAGRYLFSVTPRIDGATAGSYIRVGFSINGSTQGFAYMSISGNNHSTDYESQTCTVIFNLSSGDYVQAYGGRNGGGGGLQFESSFSGILLA